MIVSSPIICNRHERKIKNLDSQIDELVYQLYDLTPEEIALVEAG